MAGARERRALSIPQIAEITRIPVRSLERLESGRFEELPGDVFVRGFLRSYARCVGLDLDETIRRYTSCGMTPAPVASPMADELASSMATLEDRRGSACVRHVATESSGAAKSSSGAVAGSGQVALPRATALPRASAVEAEGPAAAAASTADSGDSAATEAESAAATGQSGARAAQGDADAAAEAPDERSRTRRARNSKRARKRRRKQHGRRRAATASATAREPAQNSPNRTNSDAAPPKAEADQASEKALAAPAAGESAGAESAAAASVEATPSSGSEACSIAPAGNVLPLPSAGAGRAHGRAHVREGSGHEGSGARPRPQRPHGARRRAATTTARPVLLIDDANPEAAERAQEERDARGDTSSWRSLLPPSLLDDDASHRGTLTLAVIILVIVATLTMSYLLRRPHISGDGVTWNTTGEPAGGDLVGDAPASARNA
ncbi:helix-turn-helix domain-containing protein [Haliangium ochraceum]|uniref:helix-turn-helix domain-containing protein n=1 Tax=Haliangium ochraceum TaxID=80816 RepID=UPI0002E848F4|nr:helix-turn-helix transcriptional regulator [Haliangium ochraceum]